MSKNAETRIAFQGELGAYSHKACLKAYPNASVIPCHTFDEAIEKVHEKKANFAMLPVENSTYGRVADIHRLLPQSNLYIVGEYFLPVDIALMGKPNANLSDIKTAISHTVLLGQCSSFLKKHGIKAIAGADTAGSAKWVDEQDQLSFAALASPLAAEIYGLKILADNVEDNHDNTTRFLLMAPEENHAELGKGTVITSFVFEVRNIPSALYKAMGGFATNGVNMTKLESYMVNGKFSATQFYADIEGHVDDPSVQLAMEELSYFSTFVKILGVYPIDANRAMS